MNRATTPAIAVVVVALVLLLPNCSGSSGAGPEPAGQLLLATTTTDGAPADTRNIVATLDVGSGAYEELPLEADHVFNARWRPDGRAVLIEALVDIDGLPVGSDPSLYIASTDHPAVMPLEAVEVDGSRPDWGPTCDVIVVRREKPGAGVIRSSLWQLALDGSAASEIVDLGGILMSPDWSGDGSRLTFRRENESISEIWVAESDGSNPTKIVGEAEGQGQQPRLSPSGSHVLFIRTVEHESGHFASQVFVQDVTSSVAQQITRDPDSVSHAVWSPDGEWIAYSDGYFWITFTRPDGSDQRRSETKGLPLDWGPVTRACGDAAAA